LSDLLSAALAAANALGGVHGVDAVQDADATKGGFAIG